MTSFFNDLFKSLNINIVVTEQQALEAIKSIDANYDGNVNKTELFNAFRALLNAPSPQNPQPPQIQPNYGVYGQYQGYPGYQPYYGGGYHQQGYPNYMGQSNPYINTSYPQSYQQQPYQQQQAPYGNYMNQSTTGYMNQSYQPPNPNNQPFNPYNSYRK